MVNLKKWEVIEHNEVKVGDLLKVVWVNKTNAYKTVTEVYKANVRRVQGNSFYLEGGSGWQNGDSPVNVSTTIYRRKVEAKPFKFPTGKGAIIEGKGKRGKVELVHIGQGRWYSLVNTGTYGQITLESVLSDLRVVTEGVV